MCHLNGFNASSILGSSYVSNARYLKKKVINTLFFNKDMNSLFKIGACVIKFAIGFYKGINYKKSISPNNRLISAVHEIYKY